MPRPTPSIPFWIREFAYPGYANVYSLEGLKHEPKLFCTETLFGDCGDWDAPTLFYAKDAAPANVFRERICKGDSDPWRPGIPGDSMGVKTNEQVKKLAKLFHGSKLYGSALAHMLREGGQTSGYLRGFKSGPLHDHLKSVLDFVVQNMPNLQAIVCLGKEAYELVSSCCGDYIAPTLPAGDCVEVKLFKRRVLRGCLYHPSRGFAGGWAARHIEWRAVADRVNKRIADAER